MCIQSENQNFFSLTSFETSKKFFSSEKQNYDHVNNVLILRVAQHTSLAEINREFSQIKFLNYGNSVAISCFLCYGVQHQWCCHNSRGCIKNPICPILSSPPVPIRFRENFLLVIFLASKKYRPKNCRHNSMIFIQLLHISTFQPPGGLKPPEVFCCSLKDIIKKGNHLQSGYLFEINSRQS